MLMRHLGYRLSLLALCSGVAAAAAASAGWAAEKAVLVIGRDAGDIRTMDPARAAETTPPLILRAVYDTLVTVTADDYNTVKPMLAESWESADDGQTLVFHLRDGLKFASGNPLTAEDVKFSLDRLKNLKDQPAYLMDNIAEVTAVDPRTVKVSLVDKSQPALKFFASTSLAILDSKLLQEHGGSSAADADKADTATQWLDNQSAGSGPYKFTAWERNSAVVMERNDDYWGPPAAFQRIIVKYMKDGASQLLALKNGDIERVSRSTL
jgi:peptide/nickel transport system substrate-binding protein